MKSLLNIVALLALTGCATEMQQQSSKTVSAAISAPRLISMGTPPSQTQKQLEFSWNTGWLTSTSFSKGWVDVAICQESRPEPRCVPAIGEVTLTPQVSDSTATVGVTITLTNDAIIESGTGGSYIRTHRHVGTSTEKITYGTLQGKSTLSLHATEPTKISLDHGITLALSIRND